MPTPHPRAWLSRTVKHFLAEDPNAHYGADGGNTSRHSEGVHNADQACRINGSAVAPSITATAHKLASKDRSI